MAKAERVLNELYDREQIRELTNQYCFLIMSGQMKKVLDLFTDDGVFISNNGLEARGKAALAAMYGLVARSRPVPFIHNHVIRVRGETAEGTCGLDVRAIIRGTHRTLTGYYRDRYVKLDGRWKFQSRVMHIVRDETGAAAEPAAAGRRRKAPRPST
jgi:uncharacterized protein (TIGR02246 family)